MSYSITVVVVVIIKSDYKDVFRTQPDIYDGAILQK